MIHIDRDSVSKPAILDSPRAEEEWERAASFFDLPVGNRSQKRFSFRLYKDREVRDALVDLFHESGTVVSDTKRGRVTIEVLGLKPKDLVGAVEE